MFYINSLELLHKELRSKRKKPVCVYFSTACEPFVPWDDILEMLYNVIALLLDNDIHILISTKSLIPGRFLKLFRDHPNKVHVQVGLTTVNDHIRTFLEPCAHSVEQRCDTLRRLAGHGISSEVRIDPLIPGLTDTKESFAVLCRKISACGITRAVTSYLFVRGANYRSMMFLGTGSWSFLDMYGKLYTERVAKYCGNNAIRLPCKEYRIDSFDMLKTLAGQHGIALTLCGCKNPDITSDCCHPPMNFHRETYRQMSLFSSYR